MNRILDDLLPHLLQRVLQHILHDSACLLDLILHRIIRASYC